MQGVVVTLEGVGGDNDWWQVHKSNLARIPLPSQASLGAWSRVAGHHVSGGGNGRRGTSVGFYWPAKFISNDWADRPVTTQSRGLRRKRTTPLPPLSRAPVWTTTWGQRGPTQWAAAIWVATTLGLLLVGKGEVACLKSLGSSGRRRRSTHKPLGIWGWGHRSKSACSVHSSFLPKQLVFVHARKTRADVSYCVGRRSVPALAGCKGNFSAGMAAGRQKCSEQTHYLLTAPTWWCSTHLHQSLPLYVCASQSVS
ncbi:hypothetical protein IF1G_06967 [Cordyceps javanica]|uniref:Uncharacterized protein n=1 Tax=Cordyceps javanica TaxID=43265 RepID=A0A545UXB9_9HYPO|nr:hypothetical protein IF1G_06967 [Cordyceps javanica]